MIFYRNYYEAGIFKISDLIIDNRIATLPDLVRKYPGLQNDFLKYFGLISMIPLEWKRAIRSSTNLSIPNLANFLSPNITFLNNNKKICASIVKKNREKMNTFPRNGN